MERRIGEEGERKRGDFYRLSSWDEIRERERERDVLDSRVRDLALRQNQFRAVHNACCPPAVVFPIRINPGWVQCRYPLLTRPVVLPADGVVFGERASRERARKKGGSLLGWQMREVAGGESMWSCGWWNVLIKTCNPFLVCVRACVCVHAKGFADARSWLASLLLPM